MRISPFYNFVPGLILFVYKWLAGLILDETVYIRNISNNYPTTMFERKSVQQYNIFMAEN